MGGWEDVCVVRGDGNRCDKSVFCDEGRWGGGGCVIGACCV